MCLLSAVTTAWRRRIAPSTTETSTTSSCPLRAESAPTAMARSSFNSSVLQPFKNRDIRAWGRHATPRRGRRRARRGAGLASGRRGAATTPDGRRARRPRGLPCHRSGLLTSRGLSPPRPAQQALKEGLAGGTLFGGERAGLGFPLRNAPKAFPYPQPPFGSFRQPGAEGDTVLRRRGLGRGRDLGVDGHRPLHHAHWSYGSTSGTTCARAGSVHDPTRPTTRGG